MITAAVGDSIFVRQMLAAYNGELIADLAAINCSLLVSGGASCYSWAFPGITSGLLTTVMSQYGSPACDVLMQQSGTNDICLGASIPLAQAQSDRITLLIVLRARYPNALILVNPCTPMVSSKVAYNQNIVALNANTKFWIDHHGDAKIIWTGDFLSTDWPDSRFLADGIHPTNDGLAFLSQRWCASIEAHS